MSVIYEVNLAVDAAIADAFGDWLAEHVDEMVALPGFEGATWYAAAPLGEDNPATADGRVSWTVHYRLDSHDSLQRYFEAFAPHMRGDGIERFGGRFTAWRRVLTAHPR